VYACHACACTCACVMCHVCASVCVCFLVHAFLCGCVCVCVSVHGLVYVCFALVYLDTTPNVPCVRHGGSTPSMQECCKRRIVAAVGCRLYCSCVLTQPPRCTAVWWFRTELAELLQETDCTCAFLHNSQFAVQHGMVWWFRTEHAGLLQETLRMRFSVRFEVQSVSCKRQASSLRSPGHWIQAHTRKQWFQHCCRSGKRDSTVAEVGKECGFA
jgi:hypothetical protein